MSKKKDKVDPSNPFAKLADLKKKLADEENERKAPAPPPRANPPPKKKSATSPDPGAQSEDEAMSFHRLMSGVVPLEATRHGRGTKTPSHFVEARAAQARETEGVREHLRELADARFEVTDDGMHVEGRRVDVAQAELRKLRRGLLPVDARIDLHGMTEGEAREAVGKFLREKRARGERCVLVIHGRGAHSPRGAGILRGEVAAWLSQGPASEHVLAFATADSADGGAGAVYVMLRR